LGQGGKSNGECVCPLSFIICHGPATVNPFSSLFADAGQRNGRSVTAPATPSAAHASLGTHVCPESSPHISHIEPPPPIWWVHPYVPTLQSAQTTSYITLFTQSPSPGLYNRNLLSFSCRCLFASCCSFCSSFFCSPQLLYGFLLLLRFYNCLMATG